MVWANIFARLSPPICPIQAARQAFVEDTILILFLGTVCNEGRESQPKGTISLKGKSIFNI